MKAFTYAFVSTLRLEYVRCVRERLLILTVQVPEDLVALTPAVTLSH